MRTGLAKFFSFFIVPIERFLDRIRAFWWSLWIKPFSSDILWHFFEKNRSWNDYTEETINPFPVNGFSLRKIYEDGIYGIPWVVLKSKNFTNYVFHRIDDFLKGLIRQARDDTLQKWKEDLKGRGVENVTIRGQRKTLDDAVGEAIEQIRRGGEREEATLRLSREEYKDIIDDLVFGAVEAAAAETFIKMRSKLSVTYGEILPGYGRAIDRTRWISDLTSFYVSEYVKWIGPIMDSYVPLVQLVVKETKPRHILEKPVYGVVRETLQKRISELTAPALMAARA